MNLGEAMNKRAELTRLRDRIAELRHDVGFENVDYYETFAVVDRLIELETEHHGESSKQALFAELIRCELVEAQCDAKHAINARESLLRRERQVFGESSIECFISRSNLARLYIRRGRRRHGIAIYDALLADVREARGEDNFFALEFELQYATGLFWARRHKQSFRMFERLIERERRVLGAEHPITVDTVETLRKFREVHNSTWSGIFRTWAWEVGEPVVQADVSAAVDAVAGPKPTDMVTSAMEFASTTKDVHEQAAQAAEIASRESE